MAEFKVGDRVVTTSACSTYYAEGCTGTIVTEDAALYGVKFDAGQQVDKACNRTWWTHAYGIKLIEGQNPLRRMEAHKEEYRARANDPATSKGKRKVNKYEQAVLDALRMDAAVLTGTTIHVGLTGKEIANRSGHPLNCITPRFAPLRRKGLIKDSGERRDKQIVWVLT